MDKMAITKALNSIDDHLGRLTCSTGIVGHMSAYHIMECRHQLYAIREELMKDE